MKKTIRWVSLAGLTTAVALAQTPAPKPEFEVTSIKPAADIVAGAAGQVNIGVHIDGAQVRINYLSLTDYISAAYQVKQYQVTGPDWIDSARFDIAAKLPDGAKRDQVPQMMAAMLHDRFGMEFHRDKKDLPVYALVVTKPALLKESPVQADSNFNLSASGSAAGVSMNFGNGASFSFADDKFQIRKLSMQQVADTLARYMDKPVLDMTGLTSTYDFDLPVTSDDYRVLLIRSAVRAGVVLPPEALRILDGASTDSLLNSLERAGLKLESRKAPLDVIVVDKILKMPIEN